MASAMKAMAVANGIPLPTPLLKLQYAQVADANAIFRDAWDQYQLRCHDGAWASRADPSHVRLEALQLLREVEWLVVLSKTDVQPHAQIARALLVDSPRADEVRVANLDSSDPLFGDVASAMATVAPLFGDSRTPTMASWPREAAKVLAEAVGLDIAAREDLREAIGRIDARREDARRAIDEARAAARASPATLLRVHANGLALMRAVVEESSRNHRFAAATERHAAARSAAQQLDDQACKAARARLRAHASRTPLADLPDEIHDILFALLNPIDAAMLRRACRKFAESPLGRARAPHLEIFNCAKSSLTHGARQFFDLRDGVDTPVVARFVWLTLGVALVTRLQCDAPKDAPRGPFLAPGPYDPTKTSEYNYQQKRNATYPFNLSSSAADRAEQPPNTVAYPISIGYLRPGACSDTVTLSIHSNTGVAICSMDKYAIKPQPLALSYPHLPLGSLRNNPIDGTACHVFVHHSLRTFRQPYSNDHTYRIHAVASLKSNDDGGCARLVMTARTTQFRMRARGNHPRLKSKRTESNGQGQPPL